LGGTFEMLSSKGFKVDGVLDGAFGGVGDEEVFVGEGVVMTSSSLDIFEEDEDEKKSGKDGIFN
ncbi:hypothetical protein Tco_1520086, partial [Tanacetum coccineum]